MTALDRPLQLAVAATFSAAPIEPVLAFWMRELDMPARVAIAPYGQLFQQLLDPKSLLSMNDHGINIVVVRLEDWLARDASAHGDEGQDARWQRDLEQKLGDFVAVTTL